MELLHAAITLALLSIIATAATLNTSIPIPYEAKILQAIEVSGECPSSEERDAVTTTINLEVRKLLQDFVIPPTGQNGSGEPPIPTYAPPCCGENASDWIRIAYFNMSDVAYDCPGSLVLYETPKRSCGRGSDYKGCLSTLFSVGGQSYSKVCGRITGYQVGPTTAFYGGSNDIDSRYMCGVSLTYGSSPRQHIWSFVSGLGHSYTEQFNCPCTSIDNATAVGIPSFINDNYFCETGTDGYHDNTFYPEKPLWDGEGCKDTSTCCTFNNPPWFCQELPESTTEDIEMRLCSNFGDFLEDTPLELLELHIK